MNASTVPVEKIDLNQTSVLNMRNVNATSSGKTCGPKAANLGQLKLMFPENVVEGLVLPFGVFQGMHMNQKMVGQSISYWEYLNRIFEESRCHGAKTEQSETAIETLYACTELEILTGSHQKNGSYYLHFLSDMERSFETAFGKKDRCQVPVFLRSDTNMEDLKDFTGAGLNLTHF